MIPAHKKAIMIHCLATPPRWGKGKSAAQMVNEVRVWHTRDRGWADIGYAAIIDYKGVWAKGRDRDADGDVWEETAAAARGWNKNAIHIALAGGYDALATDKFSDHFTKSQDKTLRTLIDSITKEAGRPLEIMGHNEVAAKGCPGFNAKAWYAEKPLVLTNPIKKPVKVNPFAAFLKALFSMFGGKK